MAEVRTLRKAMDGSGFFVTSDDRDATIDRLKYAICEKVLTHLVNQDRDRQNAFFECD